MCRSIIIIIRARWYTRRNLKLKPSEKHRADAHSRAINHPERDDLTRRSRSTVPFDREQSRPRRVLIRSATGTRANLSINPPVRRRKKWVAVSLRRRDFGAHSEAGRVTGGRWKRPRGRNTPLRTSAVGAVLCPRSRDVIRRFKVDESRAADPSFSTARRCPADDAPRG